MHTKQIWERYPTSVSLGQTSTFPRFCLVCGFSLWGKVVEEEILVSEVCLGLLTDLFLTTFPLGLFLTLEAISWLPTSLFLFLLVVKDVLPRIKKACMTLWTKICPLTKDTKRRWATGQIFGSQAFLIFDWFLNSQEEKELRNPKIRNKPSRRDHSLSLRIYPGKSTFATLFLLEDKWSMSCGLFSRIRFLRLSSSPNHIPSKKATLGCGWMKTGQW